MKSNSTQRHKPQARTLLLPFPPQVQGFPASLPRDDLRKEEGSQHTPVPQGACTWLVFENTESGARAWGHIPALPLPGFVTPGKLSTLSVPPFLHKTGDDNSTYFIVLM